MSVLPEKTIDQNVAEQLNSFFSGEYERQINIVESLCRQYKLKSDDLTEKISEWIAGAKDRAYEYDLSEIEAYFKTLKLALEKNINILETKIKEPSRRINVEYSDDILLKLKSAMEDYNKKISEHNKLVDDYAMQRNNLINDIWALVINENTALIEAYLKANERINKALTGMRTTEKSFDKEIAKLDTQMPTNPGILQACNQQLMRLTVR